MTARSIVQWLVDTGSIEPVFSDASRVPPELTAVAGLGLMVVTAFWAFREKLAQIEEIQADRPTVDWHFVQGAETKNGHPLLRLTVTNRGGSAARMSAQIETLDHSPVNPTRDRVVETIPWANHEYATHVSAGESAQLDVCHLIRRSDGKPSIYMWPVLDEKSGGVGYRTLISVRPDQTPKRLRLRITSDPAPCESPSLIIAFSANGWTYEVEAGVEDHAGGRGGAARGHRRWMPSSSSREPVVSSARRAS